MRRHIPAICILSLLCEIAGAPSARAQKPSKNAVRAGVEKGSVRVLSAALQQAARWGPTLEVL